MPFVVYFQLLKRHICDRLIHGDSWASCVALGSPTELQSELRTLQSTLLHRSNTTCRSCSQHDRGIDQLPLLQFALSTYTSKMICAVLDV